MDGISKQLAKVKIDEGSTYVGGTVRKDGTVRRVVKIRPGYIAPENVSKYVPRAKRTDPNEGKLLPGGSVEGNEDARISAKSGAKKAALSQINRTLWGERDLRGEGRCKEKGEQKGEEKGKEKSEEKSEKKSEGKGKGKSEETTEHTTEKTNAPINDRPTKGTEAHKDYKAFIRHSSQSIESLSTKSSKKVYIAPWKRKINSKKD